MNASNLSKRALQLPLIAVGLFVLSACTGIVSTPKTAPPLFNALPGSAEYLLQQADKISEQKNTDWQLAAIEALIKEQKYILANSVIEHLQRKALTTDQRNILLLLNASNQYSQNKLAEGLHSINNIDTMLLSPIAYLHYLKLKIALHTSNQDHQIAVDTLFTLAPLLTIAEEKQQYNDQLFSQLILLPSEVLNQFQPSTADSKDKEQDDNNTKSPHTFAEELAEIAAEIDQTSAIEEDASSQLTTEEMFVQGWYNIAAAYKRYRFNVNQLLHAIEVWKLMYPAHPMLEFMPSQLLNIPAATPYRPTKVAVLLPLSGRFKQPAQALQYGISHAFYNKIALKKQASIEKNTYQENEENLAIHRSFNTADNEEKNSITSDNEQMASIITTENNLTPPSPSLIFFDTNAMTMQAIAEQLKVQNIDFIIGPLLKPNLERFLPLVKDIPTLVLNSFPAMTLDDSDSNNALEKSTLHYAFPLSPENEAEQAAELIFQNKHKKPLIFAPKSKFGERVSAAFKARWDALNANQQTESQEDLVRSSAETHLFTSKSQLASFIATSMQTDKSKQRIRQMKSIINEPLKTEVRSRRDADAIYLVGKRDELILLKPFIAVSISPFANQIPLYASSRSHDVDLTHTQNKELSDLTFSDVAFLIDDNNQINQQIQTIWPKQHFETLRLFALGYDSYNLIEQLNQLQIIEGYQYQGLVGELTLDKNNTLHSQLQWAKYQRGSLIEVTTPISNK